ncbi:MAG: response regulator transcription factor [Planctomycetota bacterium]|jgi:two-component system response regulator FixJ
MKKIADQHIFVVDDEPKVCQIICETLENAGAQVSCFVRAAECLEQLHSQRCDLLITDLRMPGIDGVELLKGARGLTPWLPVLIITGYGDVRTAVKAMKAGAVDFIEKPLVKNDFVQKVKSILQRSASADAFLGKSLTRTEKRVLRLVVDGKSNTEIANLLHRSKRTIEVHRAHLMEKLGVDNIVDLVKRVAVMKLIDL